MRADVRIEVKKEVTGKFGHVLAEARLEAQTLRKEREADALLIAELLAQKEAYEDQICQLTGDSPGQGR